MKLTALAVLLLALILPASAQPLPQPSSATARADIANRAGTASRCGATLQPRFRRAKANARATGCKAGPIASTFVGARRPSTAARMPRAPQVGGPKTRCFWRRFPPEAFGLACGLAIWEPSKKVPEAELAAETVTDPMAAPKAERGLTLVCKDPIVTPRTGRPSASRHCSRKSEATCAIRVRSCRE